MSFIKFLFSYNFIILRSKLEVLLNGQVYCFFMNRISKKGVNYIFYKGNYCVIENNQKHHFIKSRGGHYAKGLRERTLDLVNSYNINKIEFQKGDLVVDVGANMGDLIPYTLNQRYIGFEASPEEYKALKKNITTSCTVYPDCVGDTDGYIEFFISSAGADSSMHKPVKVESTISVKSIRLDGLIFEKVKLLKIDAEGAEIEVINGARNLLHLIEFIAIDLGFEKGVNQVSTAPAMFNLLYEFNFRLIEIGKNERYLFRNTLIN